MSHTREAESPGVVQSIRLEDVSAVLTRHWWRKKLALAPMKAEARYLHLKENTFVKLCKLLLFYSKHHFIVLQRDPTSNEGHNHEYWGWGPGYVFLWDMIKARTLPQFWKFKLWLSYGLRSSFISISANPLDSPRVLYDVSGETGVLLFLVLSLVNQRL